VRPQRTGAAGLREKKAHGDIVNEDLLYKLELFHKRRTDEEINEDELFELGLFERAPMLERNFMKMIWMSLIS
jgi:hypothetical protein